MKTVILGFSSGISRSPAYSIWTQSAVATGNAVHVLRTDSATEIPGVRTFRVNPRWLPAHSNAIHHFAHARWESIHRWARSVGRQFDAVCLSDVRDTVFQGDPFPDVVPAGKGRWLAAGLEPWRASEHDWCRDQMQRMAKILAERWEDGPEFCGGCIFGDPGSIASLACWMSVACRFVAAHGISDQAPLNLYLRARPVRPVPMETYLHGEAVKLGWIDAEEGWDSVAIYHQYDRVPKHAAAIRMRWPIPSDAVRTQVVISRHEEEIAELVSKVLEYSPVVYDKGNGTSGGIPRPNIGFEAETWMHHFARNYNTLPEVTVCLQGQPFQHCAAREIDAVLQRDPETISFEPLGEGREQTASGLPDHPGLAQALARMWRELFGVRVPPARWYCWYGGQFAVHRDIVRRRSRKWYARAARLIRSKEDACAVERMWPLIFAP